MESLGSFLKRLPVVDDKLFWLALTSFLFLYGGVTGSIYQYYRPFVLTIAAYLGFLIFAALTWRRWTKKPLVELELVMSALAFLAVLALSGGQPGAISGYGAVLGVSNLILAYISYQSWREGTTGKLTNKSEPQSG